MLTIPQFEALSCRKVAVSYNEYGGYCFPVSAVNRPVARDIIDRKVWEPETIQFMRENCDGNIVHAGAYFGDFLPALSPVCETLYAFEPCRESFECAEITTWINRLDNVVLRNSALGSVNKTLKLETHAGTLGGNSRIRADGDEEVSAVTLDSLSLENISILQLDVEGFEEDALKGAMATITRDKPILVIEMLQGSPLMQVNSWFTDAIIGMGYRMVKIIEGNVVFQTSI